jgi:NitT/TauT family transport system substrate-binding protein
MILRRDFLRTSAATIAALAAPLPARIAAEAPPETTRIRIGSVPSICLSPQYVAGELLRADGFTDIQYVPGEGGVPAAKEMGAGTRDDLGTNMAAPLVVALDRGAPIVVLAGVHVGCFELIATHRIRTIKDLKGKTVAVFGLESAQHIFLASMASLVGLDPRKDITWVTYPADEAKQLLAEGKVDAFLGFPPDPQDLRARNIGHVVVNSATDRPWSQYFCCMVAANREFVTRYPVATKRALRAILKADEICALDPGRAARAYRERGFAGSEELVLKALREIPFGRWRAYDPADTMRFYALRLHEAGMIKSSPQKILAQGTDWRFLNELKKELKG